MHGWPFGPVLLCVHNGCLIITSTEHSCVFAINGLGIFTGCQDIRLHILTVMGGKTGTSKQFAGATLTA